MASSSRGQQRVEDIYEQQNDQRLDELHSKLRTLKGITTDIHADVESQNTLLDHTNDRFASFGTSLGNASTRARQAFGIGPGAGTLKPWRIATLVVGLFIGVWFASKVLAWWWWTPVPIGDSNIPA
ncbi:Bet1-like protein [Ephemerocybe angulata]|uniref:Bet1-like protein n=1 Tax=Ephemerocybe angulata TaxID=980116 RepID=A0A8H6LYF3_9AGAR|nr:Bet1-like protein [Tulosesus angulatus]